MMQEVLVIGGAGYIGSHAVATLVDEGYQVVVVDNLSTGHRQAVHPSATFYECDLRDKATLTEIFKAHHFDGVFHFAAYSLVGESVYKPLEYFNNNVYGMQILLEVMVETGVNKLIFSSSAAVYGEVPMEYITEETQPHPASPYGETKLMMEEMIHWCTKAYDLRYVSLRYFNVAGARKDGSIGEDHQPETHLVPIILQTALGQREKLVIFGDDYATPDGTCIRDYVHVDDLIDAHIQAFHYLESHSDSQIFNLGSSRGYSVKEMWQAAKSVTGKDIPAEIGERRAGDPARLVAESSKARQVLRWEPKYDEVQPIIETAWQWHQHHPSGYQDK